jgi:hypothetical protein
MNILDNASPLPTWLCTRQKRAVATQTPIRLYLRGRPMSSADFEVYLCGVCRDDNVARIIQND